MERFPVDLNLNVAMHLEASVNDDRMVLQIVDRTSRVRILSVEMSPKIFTDLLRSRITDTTATTSTRGLTVLGKRIVRKEEYLTVPGTHHTKPELQKLLKQLVLSEGTAIDINLSSQGDVTVKGKDTVVRYSTFTFQEQTDAANEEA